MVLILAIEAAVDLPHAAVLPVDPAGRSRRRRRSTAPASSRRSCGSCCRSAAPALAAVAILAVPGRLERLLLAADHPPGAGPLDAAAGPVRSSRTVFRTQWPPLMAVVVAGDPADPRPVRLLPALLRRGHRGCRRQGLSACLRRPPASRPRAAAPARPDDRRRLRGRRRATSTTTRGGSCRRTCSWASALVVVLLGLGDRGRARRGGRDRCRPRGPARRACSGSARMATRGRDVILSDVVDRVAGRARCRSLLTGAGVRGRVARPRHQPHRRASSSAGRSAGRSRRAAFWGLGDPGRARLRVLGRSLVDPERAGMARRARAAPRRAARPRPSGPHRAAVDPPGDPARRQHGHRSPRSSRSRSGSRRSSRAATSCRRPTARGARLGRRGTARVAPLGPTTLTG